MGHNRSFSSRQYLLTATPREIIGPSDRRYAVIIMPPLNGTAFIGTDNTISIGNGISLHHDSDPLFLCRDQVGDLVNRGLWAVGLAAYGVNRDFASGQLNNYVSGAGDQTATVVCPALSYVEIDSIFVGVDKTENFTWVVFDTVLGTIIGSNGLGSVNHTFVPPIRCGDLANASVKAFHSATSATSYAGLMARSVRGPSGLSEALNLSVIEVFDCGCKVADVPSIINYFDRGR